MRYAACGFIAGVIAAPLDWGIVASLAAMVALAFALVIATDPERRS